MKTNTIVQFECFETNLNLDEFVKPWEFYAKKFTDNGVEVTLHQRISGTHKFRYVSRHDWPEDNFQFTFMKGRISAFFSEGNVKVVQAGGYTPIHTECLHDVDNTYRKMLVFLPVSDNNTEDYTALSFHRYINIYQSYFESCLYGYILEFFIDSAEVPHFLEWLKINKPGIEAGLYRECLALHE
jgi:hypothetical protein